MPYLQTKDLSVDDFIDLIKRFSPPDDAWWMAFSPAAAIFDFFSMDEPFLRETDQGRIFSGDGELKWRRIGDRFRVVFLGEGSPPDGLDDESPELENLQPDENHMEFFLWGNRTNKGGKWIDEWIEQQAPHRFKYPVTGKEDERGRVKIVVENWIDDSKMPIFSRYRGVIEASGGESNA